MKSKIDFISNGQMLKENMDQILQLKMQHWPYPFEKQSQWVKKNLSIHDEHVCLFLPNNKLVAYLNLVNLFISMDEIKTDVIGIGNVCVDKAFHGKGFGRSLMEEVNLYLNKNNKLGLLLCRKELEGFYSKNGWHIFQGEITIGNQVYENLVFFNLYVKGKYLKIEKSF